MAINIAIRRWMMSRSYTIAQARNHFASIVHEAEEDAPVEVTRRGQSVAVVLSMQTYRRLVTARTDFWEAYSSYRRRIDLAQMGIEPEVFAGVRDSSPGREVTL
ncbi:MAG: type II toxin-antitoxin system Phd/YefM family antitoxin [Caldilineales bacterium]|nr:type II toxin-antitoxin system Phd/YefM family antitoxin [Caldilineales bacterium]MCW5858302.1 type II toxin-antitoxin system Phd/YefM family antitoxin [Caldilineales bacterium]